MKKLGYNMFNINDPFYQDLCTPYKTENDTDMPLSARKDYIYNNKDSQCQSNCQFSSYLLNSLYINCSCNIEQKEEKGEEIKKFSGKTLYEIFYDVLKYANFNILKCHNLIFDKLILQKNIGNYVIIVFILFYLISFIFFISKGISPIKSKIEKLTPSSKKLNGNNIIVFINNIKIQKKSNNNKSKKNKNKIPSNPKKKKFTRKKIKKNEIIGIKNDKNKINLKKYKTPKYNGNLMENKSSFSSKESLNFNFQNENINEVKNDKELNGFELNQLEYDEAIYYDKRSFIKIYFDLLSREHIIIFTFCGMYFFTQMIQCIKYF